MRKAGAGPQSAKGREVRRALRVAAPWLFLIGAAALAISTAYTGTLPRAVASAIACAPVEALCSTDLDCMRLCPKDDKECDGGPQ